VRRLNVRILRHKNPTSFGVIGRIHDIGYTPNVLWWFTRAVSIGEGRIPTIVV
jgi:hypothetical protein